MIELQKLYEARCLRCGWGTAGLIEKVILDAQQHEREQELEAFPHQPIIEVKANWEIK